MLHSARAGTTSPCASKAIIGWCIRCRVFGLGLLLFSIRADTVFIDRCPLAALEVIQLAGALIRRLGNVQSLDTVSAVDLRPILGLVFVRRRLLLLKFKLAFLLKAGLVLEPLAVLGDQLAKVAQIIDYMDAAAPVEPSRL